MKGIVITGPTGAIGMALIKKSIEKKINVLAICHKGSKRITRIPQSEYVKIIELSLDEYKDYIIENDLSVKYDVFFHLAWNGTVGDSRNNTDLQVDNIKFTLDAVELAKRLGCNTFVGAGSQAEYGRVEGRLSASTPTNPENGYGIAKLAAGNMSRIRCEQLGIKHIWTRILSVYGPYDGENSMISVTLKKMLANEETHFTAGEQKWDYLYSEDAARMMFHIAESGESGKVYCLGNGTVKPLKEYIEEMYRLTGCTARLGLGDIPYAERQVMYLAVEQGELVCTPEVTFSDGIKRVIDYMNE